MYGHGGEMGKLAPMRALLFCLWETLRLLLVCREPSTSFAKSESDAGLMTRIIDHYSRAKI